MNILFLEIHPSKWLHLKTFVKPIHRYVGVILSSYTKLHFLIDQTINIVLSLSHEFQKQISKVIWLGEPRGIGGTKGKRERKREKEMEREKGARPGEPMGASPIAPPLKLSKNPLSYA